MADPGPPTKEKKGRESLRAHTDWSWASLTELAVSSCCALGVRVCKGRILSSNIVRSPSFRRRLFSHQPRQLLDVFLQRLQLQMRLAAMDVCRFVAGRVHCSLPLPSARHH
jgi:hypothetical protein